MYPTIDKVKTGIRLRELLKRKGITVKQVQKYLGLSCVQSVYHWLDGTTLPTLDNLYALSQLLGVSMDFMIKREKSDTYQASEEAIQRMIMYHCRISSIITV